MQDEMLFHVSKTLNLVNLLQFAHFEICSHY